MPSELLYRAIPAAYSVRIARLVATSDRRLLSAAPSETVALVKLYRRRLKLIVGIRSFWISVAVLSFV